MVTLLKTREVAEFFKTSEAAIRSKVQRRCKTIPMPRKIGRVNYWLMDDLEKFVKQHRPLGQ